ncbi:hypothetical protein HOD96_00540 [Candidatus Falkowbacteria bacterium]|jgi:hypothetical protein|nr:hypothetical protein [Candidatus Falkowbacteria bacterium]MBT4433274.1 hypothetical protein [Candidatus Falkowbacteria bacterium]
MANFKVDEAVLKDVLAEFKISFVDEVFKKVKTAIQMELDNERCDFDAKKIKKNVRKILSYIDKELSKTGIDKYRFKKIWLKYQLKDSVFRAYLLGRY